MNAHAITYNLLFRARNVSRVVAKILAWITGIPAVIIALWASGLGRPAVESIGTGNPFALRFALCLAALYGLPPLFNYAMRRVAAAAQAKAQRKANA